MDAYEFLAARGVSRETIEEMKNDKVIYEKIGLERD